MIAQKTKPTLVEKREKFFLDLYEENFPKTAAWIKKSGGSYEEAQDVFQDALVIFYEKLKSEKKHIENQEAYLAGIVKHLWYRKYSEIKKEVRKGDFDNEIASQVDEYLRPSLAKLMKVMEAAGKKCMHLLKAFYYHNESLNQIAADFGFSGTRSATVQKYKCLEKVRDHVKEKEAEYADFLD